MICLSSKIYCCFDQNAEKIKFNSRKLNKKTREETGAGPVEKNRRVLERKNDCTIRRFVDCEQCNNLSVHKNKQSGDCPIFIQKKVF